MQAICDHKKRFIYISIKYGPASSDHLAFEVCKLRHQLSEAGSLADGLVLFGDNAYVNTTYMVTPYANVLPDLPQDDYNFFTLCSIELPNDIVSVA